MIFIEGRNLTKRFGERVANHSVSISIKQGEIHGIVGENGAGKSTLMKMLYGMLHPDSGEVLVKGSVVHLSSPETALKLGIGMVHQHFMLVEALTVLENLILGDEPSQMGIIHEKKALQEFTHLISELDVSMKPDLKVQNLSVGLQQRLEILKLLFRKSDCLIFDEPTGVLAPQEVDRFLDLLLRLKTAGKTIILITHKLNEVKKVCDRVTVMRAGKKIETVETKSIDILGLTRLMVGHEISGLAERRGRQRLVKRKPLLKAENISAGKIKNLSFEIHSGEILGVAGIEGNGQKELAEILWGIRKIESGNLYFQDQKINDFSILSRKGLGLSYIPEDRHRNAGILDLSLIENFYLGSDNMFPSSLVFPRKKLADALEASARDFEIKMISPDQPLKYLSGGNQQKIVLARELFSQPKLLIASQPTRGVDIGAIDRIHRELMARRDSGLSILLISCEFDELLALSDRVLVMRDYEFVSTQDDLDQDWEQLRYKIGEAMICR